MHEAAHAVAVVSMGKPLEQIEFGLTFERDYDGKTLALPRGAPKKPCGPFHRMTVGCADKSARQTRLRTKFHLACRTGERDDCVFYEPAPAILKRAARELDTRRTHIDCVSRYSFELAPPGGRDGAAFARLAWRDANRLMDVPLIWKAIAAVEAQLFSSLLRLEPADPRPGDVVKYVMPGSRAEELIAAVGIELPSILGYMDIRRKKSRSSGYGWF